VAGLDRRLHHHGEGGADIERRHDIPGEDESRRRIEPVRQHREKQQARGEGQQQATAADDEADHSRVPERSFSHGFSLGPLCHLGGLPQSV
jgi:hypothetical protein